MLESISEPIGFRSQWLVQYALQGPLHSQIEEVELGVHGLLLPERLMERWHQESEQGVFLDRIIGLDGFVVDTHIPGDVQIVQDRAILAAPRFSLRALDPVRANRSLVDSIRR